MSMTKRSSGFSCHAGLDNRSVGPRRRELRDRKSLVTFPNYGVPGSFPPPPATAARSPGSASTSCNHRSDGGELKRVSGLKRAGFVPRCAACSPKPI